MDNWIKIEDETFYVEEVSMQLTIGAHASINISLDISKYPDYSDVFFNKFDKSEKFTLVAKSFETRGTLIKTIDIGKKLLNISLKCDYTNQTPIDERRDILINQILNNDDKKS